MNRVDSDDEDDLCADPESDVQETCETQGQGRARRHLRGGLAPIQQQAMQRQLRYQGQQQPLQGGGQQSAVAGGSRAGRISSGACHQYLSKRLLRCCSIRR